MSDLDRYRALTFLASGARRVTAWAAWVAARLGAARRGTGLAAVMAVAAGGILPATSANPARPASPPPPVKTAAAFRQIILPDLVLIDANGIAPARLASLARIRGLRDMLAVDGAQITVNGHRANVIGVDVDRYRSWTTLGTASKESLWTSLAGGAFITSPAARKNLDLDTGKAYPLTGIATDSLTFGGSAPLGVAGIDAVVNTQASGKLGLVHNVAAFVSAPGKSLPTLRREVRAAVGSGGTLVNLRQQALPVDPAGSGRPANYIQLFQASAARYCPGMSWTVLAAIGQIESGDGTNEGPSSAGALGPMQFLPSTWATWGITAFGEHGAPNIWDPYDAVPSAARYLCASGAGSPAGLSGAIFAYNHAQWYVSEVLALAQQYARADG